MKSRKLILILVVTSIIGILALCGLTVLQPFNIHNNIFQTIESIVFITIVIIICLMFSFLSRKIEILEYAREIHYRLSMPPEINKVGTLNSPKGQTRVPRTGRIEILVIIEVLFKNHAFVSKVLGRFLISDWIFDTENISCHDKHCDYRVYDIFTRERINLQHLRLLQPGEIWGFRLEIVQTDKEPVVSPEKQRTPLNTEIFKRLPLSFQVDGQNYEHVLDTPMVHEVDSLKKVFKWAIDLSSPNTEISPSYASVLPKRTIYYLDHNPLTRIIRFLRHLSW